MRAILLIAGNFIREQRWTLLALSILPFFMAVLLRYDRTPHEDLVFALGQLYAYAVFLAFFLSATAIHNERKTRRILGVLSKAVERGDYLAGLAIGICGCVVVYCTALGLAGAWLLLSLGMAAEGFVLGLGLVIVAALLAGMVVLLFTTMLPPIFAVMAGTVVLGSPLLIARFFDVDVSGWMPGYALLIAAAKGTMDVATAIEAWPMAAVALGEAVVLWWVASEIFARRDIAVAIE
jgi:ABC-type transport system involved in multi-copper enzyme maturation permease subunit